MKYITVAYNDPFRVAERKLYATMKGKLNPVRSKKANRLLDRMAIEDHCDETHDALEKAITEFGKWSEQ